MPRRAGFAAGAVLPALQLGHRNRILRRPIRQGRKIRSRAEIAIDSARPPGYPARVTLNSRTKPVFRVHGRSFLVLVLRPEPPVDDWLAELDAQVARSPAFLESKPVLVDLGGVTEDDADLPALVRALQSRGLRILAVEGVDPSWAGAAEWGGAIPGGRSTGMVELPGAVPALPAEDVCAQPDAPGTGAGPTDAGQIGAGQIGAGQIGAGLVIAEPVRSGQTVICPTGDVTVLGSVASGAEVFAGGSVHVYGALRGRVVAGFNGNPRARIFCRRLEAELVAIDGVYRTADDMDATLRGRPVQAWLEGDIVVMAALE